MFDKTRTMLAATAILMVAFLVACKSDTVPVTRLVEVETEVTKEVPLVVTRIVVEEKRSRRHG